MMVFAVCAAVSAFALGCGSGKEDSGDKATPGKAKELVGDATNEPAQELCGSLQPAAEDATGTAIAPAETLYDVSEEVGTLLACGYAYLGESDPVIEVSRSWDNPQHTLRGMTGGFNPAECAFTLGVGDFSCLTHESGEVDTATWSEGESDIAIQLVSLDLSRSDVLRLMEAAIDLEQVAVEGEESGTDVPKPSSDSAATASQVEQRLKATGYPVEVEATAPPRVGTFSVSFDGGPTDSGYEITTYVYETAQDASGELEEVNAQFGSMPPEEEEARVVETRLYLAVAGPGGTVPAGALDKFVKVAEGG